ncbi:capsule biosynthesis GfcC family protein [Alkalimonas sp. NCh-2]|uniref:capsule biosynthesis GfcC family protein n=1 Tax=Alkalimonas sp. NCh-2 TaxID=3144846 RepID=UPI0031F68B3E
MMRLFSVTAVLLCLLLRPVVAETAAEAAPVVTVAVQGQLLQFEQRPRLLDLLQHAQLDERTYWPAARLYRDSPGLIEQQQQFIAELQQLQQHFLARKQRKQANAVHALLVQVRSWQLAEPVIVPVDLDRARAALQHNPRLDAGHYLLQLPARPQWVYPAGLYQETAPLAHKRLSMVGEYLTTGYRLPLADINQVLLLQPDGSQQWVGVAYWNRQRIAVQPGAQILVPFGPRALPAKYRHLNQTLIDLAMHRVFE